jgi:hypothetical protein
MTVLVAAVLGMASLVVLAPPASANVNLGPGWSIWTREYCEDGAFVNMRRLDFSGRGTQGREYIYRRNGRLCAFVVDHMAGSHWIDVTARHQKSWGIDTGYYTEYAGAVAGPAGKCIEVHSTLQIPAPRTTYLYSTRWRRFC